MMIISSSFIFNFTNFCVIVSFLTKLLTLGISYSTAVRVVVVAKLLILSILFLTSFILTLRTVVAVAKLVTLGTSHLTSFILALTEVLVTKLVTSGVLSSTFFI